MSLRSHESALPEGAFPLSSAQRSIWFAQQLAPHVPICIAQYIDLRGDLDIDLLCRVSYRAGGEFQSAYLRILEVDGEPYQVVDSSIATETIPQFDFRDEPDPLRAARDWMDADYARPVDLTTDLLVNMAILQIADDRYLWYTRIHHVALDGYAAMTMLNRAAALYTAAHEQREPDSARAADLRTLYDWDRDYHGSTRYVSDRDYWLERVAGLEDGSTLAQRDAPTAAQSLLTGTALSDDLVRALALSDETASSSATATVIAAFATYLARMTGHDDVVINLPVSARTTAVVRRSGGMLVNTAPLHIGLTADDTRHDLVQRVQLELTGALRHQRFSLEDIRREGGAAGDPTRYAGPMVNVMLFHQELTLGDIRGEFHIMTSGPVEDLLVNIYQSGTPAKTFIDFRGNPHRYHRDELAGHHAAFVALLDEFLRAPADTPLDRIDTATAEIGRRRRHEVQSAAFSRRALAGAPEQLRLPRTTPGEATAAPDDDTRGTVDTTIAVTATDLDALAAVSSDPDDPWYPVLHAATAIVAARLTAEENTVVGRPGPAILLPLCARVDGAEPFSTLVDRLTALDTEAAGYAEITADDLAAAGTAPIPPVVLAVTGDTTAPDTTAPDTTAPDTTAALTLHLTVTADELAVHAVFRRADIDAHTAEDFVTRLGRVLTAACADPHRPIGDLPVVADGEPHGLLPARGRPAMSPQLWPELLSAVAAIVPDSPALVYGDRSVTYGELDLWSNRFARVLLEEGAGPERIVALGIARSIESVAALWAVAKAGAAFVPIDPAYPLDRIEYMLTDSGAVLGLTTGTHRPHLPDLVPWLELDAPDLRDRIEHTSGAPVTDADRPCDLHFDHAAYLIYTSGSTGRPKGVLVPHRGLANLSATLHTRLAPPPTARVSHFSSPSFDASIFEYMTAFGVGATLVVVPATVYGGDELTDLLNHERVTHMFSTPAALASLDPARLQAASITVAGEACPPELAARWAPGRRMFNGYGPTETTIVVTSPNHSSQGSPSPSGRRSAGSPRSSSTPGCIRSPRCGGRTVHGGRRRRPRLSRPRRPHRDTISSPMPYGTGSASTVPATWCAGLADDTLEYVGRSDFQVKSRGLRIELGEIDAVLLEHETVTRPPSRCGRDRHRRRYDSRRVRGRRQRNRARRRGPSRTPACARCPRHMVPTVARVLDAHAASPRTASSTATLCRNPMFGAAERASHRSSGTEHRGRAECSPNCSGSTGSELDDQLLRPRRQLPDRDPRGRPPRRPLRHAPCRSATCSRLPPSPDLAATSTRAAAAAHRRTAPDRAPRPERIPLSPAQQRMWFVNRFDTTSAAYNIPVAFDSPADSTSTRCARPCTTSSNGTRRCAPVTRTATARSSRSCRRRRSTSTRSRPPSPRPTCDRVRRRGRHRRIRRHRRPAGARCGCCSVHDDAARRRRGRAPHRRRRRLAGPLARDLDDRLPRPRSTADARSGTPLPVQYADYTLWHRADSRHASTTPARSRHRADSTSGRERSPVLPRSPRPAHRPAAARRPAVPRRHRAFEIDPALHRGCGAPRPRTRALTVHGGARRARRAARAACPAATTSPSALPSRVAASPSSTTSSACSSTPWCCAPRCTVGDIVRRPARTRSATATSTRSRTPTCRSSGSSRLLDPVRSTAHHPLFQVAARRSRTSDRPTCELPDLTIDIGRHRRSPSPSSICSLTVVEIPRLDDGTPLRMSAPLHVRHRPVRRADTPRGFADRLCG